MSTTKKRIRKPRAPKVIKPSLYDITLQEVAKLSDPNLSDQEKQAISDKVFNNVIKLAKPIWDNLHPDIKVTLIQNLKKD